MRRLPAVAVALAAALLLSACGSTSGKPEAAEPDRPGTVPGHIHSLATDPDSGDLLAATHAGLFALKDDGTARHIGDELDLMSFTVGPGGVFYASGHPGPGMDLPGPLGLVRSDDGGRSWTPVSRGGESDFHALAASARGLAAFDGSLLFSTDGTDWQPAPGGFQPAKLSGFPGGDVVLATAENGVQRSSDGGRTWAAVEGSPVLLTTAFSDAQNAVGVTPDGVVHTSSDAGLSWKRAGTVGGQPAGAAADGDNIWVAVGEQILRSTDDGASFSPLGG